MATTNGNKALVGLVSIFVTVAIFVTGQVVGSLRAQVDQGERFVTRAQYDKDQSRIERQLDDVVKELREINRKLPEETP